MILDNYPFLNYLPIGALDGATEVGPSFIYRTLFAALDDGSIYREMCQNGHGLRRAAKCCSAGNRNQNASPYECNYFNVASD